MGFSLETERLILREMVESDFKSLYEILGDPEIMQHYPYSFDEERVRTWIARNIDRYRIFGFGLWAVCLKESGEMIGDCGLTMQMIGNVIRPEIGYHIRRDQQRKGYAREAACAVRDWTFENTPFNEIYSYMKYTNEASAGCAQSWGCSFAEEFENEVNEVAKVFRITRDEWNVMKNTEAYENSAEAFDRKIGTLTNYDEAYAYFASLLREGNSVLDVACGPGNISRFVAKKVSGLKFTLMDLSSSMLYLASCYLPGSRTLCCDISDFELNERFDGIINGFGLPYLTPEKALRHFACAAAHLKEGGFYYLSFMNVNAELNPGMENYMQEEHPSFNPEATVRVNYHSQEVIERQLAEAGFSVMKKWNLDYQESDGSITTDVVLICRKNAVGED